MNIWLIALVLFCGYGTYVLYGEIREFFRSRAAKDDPIDVDLDA